MARGATDPATVRREACPDPAAVVDAHLRAFNAGDVDALLDWFTPDAVWLTGRSRARGRAELAELFGCAMAELGPVLTVRAMVSSGRLVACELTEVLALRGSQRCYPIAGFYQVACGRNASARIYRVGAAEVI